MIVLPDSSLEDEIVHILVRVVVGVKVYRLSPHAETREVVTLGGLHLQR